MVLKVILVKDLPKKLPKAVLQRRKYVRPNPDVERKKVSRCVALIAFLLLGVCFALMGVSFSLTSKIDEMGELLKISCHRIHIYCITSVDF
jgi:hypothetical protein